jgi:hypothetical protein
VGIGGRPDVMKLIKEVYVQWQAEVVFITSNWQGNKEMMEGCKEAGIPAVVSVVYSPLSTGWRAYCAYGIRERSGTFDSRLADEILEDRSSRLASKRLYHTYTIIISYRQCGVSGGKESSPETSPRYREKHGIDFTLTW